MVEGNVFITRDGETNTRAILIRKPGPIKAYLNNNKVIVPNPNGGEITILPADPWDQTTMQDQLNQFTTWSVVQRSGVARNLAQLVMGRPLGGGVAWLHALCNTQKGYALFQWDAVYAFPTAATTWDAMVTAHEIGHNFGSEHTQSCFWSDNGIVPVGALLERVAP